MFSHSRAIIHNGDEYFAAKLICLLFYLCVNELEVDQKIRDLLRTSDGQGMCRRALDYLSCKPKFGFNKQIESERLFLILCDAADGFRRYRPSLNPERDDLIVEKNGKKPNNEFLKFVANKLKCELSKSSKDRLSC